MMSDEIARSMFADDNLDDVVDRSGLPGRPTAVAQVVDKARDRESLILWQRRSKYRSEQHFVGAAKRLCEIVLEHPAARRRRTWFEDRPDARGRIRGSEAGQCFANRSRMMREIIVDGDPVGFADDFEPALHAR